MVSIQVQLDDDVAEVIRRLAAAQACSENDIIRDAVASYAQSHRPLPKGMGQYRSGSSDVSERAREILRDAARDGTWP